MAHEKRLTPQRELLRQELNALQAAVSDDTDDAPPTLAAASDMDKAPPAKVIRPRITPARKKPSRHKAP